MKWRGIDRKTQGKDKDLRQNERERQTDKGGERARDKGLETDIKRICKEIAKENVCQGKEKMKKSETEGKKKKKR